MASDNNNNKPNSSMLDVTPGVAAEAPRLAAGTDSRKRLVTKLVLATLVLTAVACAIGIPVARRNNNNNNDSETTNNQSPVNGTCKGERRDLTSTGLRHSYGFLIV